MWGRGLPTVCKNWDEESTWEKSGVGDVISERLFSMEAPFSSFPWCLKGQVGQTLTTCRKARVNGRRTARMYKDLWEEGYRQSEELKGVSVV